MVRATVTDDGEVSIQGVTTMAGEIVDVSACKVEERLALYEECRLAAGVCPSCAGAGKLRRIQGPKRPAIDIGCPTCKGSRKAPTILARLNPDTPTRPLPEFGVGPLQPTPPPSGLSEPTPGA